MVCPSRKLLQMTPHFFKELISMNSFKFILFFNILVLTALAGCNTTLESKEKISESIENVDIAMKSASDILYEEIKSRPSVRRMEAIKYYINHGNNDLNITGKTSKDIEESFARYVCTGVGAFQRDLAAVKYAKNYTNSLKLIIEPGKDTLWGQVEKLRTLGQMNQKLPEPKATSSQEAFDFCIKETLTILRDEFDGHTALDVSGEMAPGVIILAISGAEELLKKLEDLARAGLKIANELKMRKVLKDFDIQNRENLERIISNNLSDEKFEKAWKRRKAASLYLPYEYFKSIFTLSRTKESIEIIKLSALINSQLNYYDTMRATTPPQDVTKTLREVEIKLHNIISDETISLEKIIGFVKSISNELKSIKKDYEGINSNWKNIASPIKEYYK